MIPRSSFYDILLVGHRGTGKTTLGRLVARRLDALVIDLDEQITQQTGRPCHQLVADDPARFRRMERAALAKLLELAPSGVRIITPGAGLDHIPEGPLCVWLWRDGWEQTAKLERARLRPELTWDAELAWMRATREPRWARAAHLRFDIPRGRSPERQAEMIADAIAWVHAARRADLTHRSWFIAQDQASLNRAASDALALGAAGLEVRSDLVSSTAGMPSAAPILASLRTDDPGWLTACARVDAIDLDLAHLESVLKDGLLARLSPRPLLLSSHPSRVAAPDLDALLSAAQRVVRSHPAWGDQLTLKFAPKVQRPSDMRRALTLLDRLQAHAGSTTFLPQGPHFAWTRPWLAHEINATNYLPLGLAQRRCPDLSTPSPPTPLDLQDWLPHLAPPRPRRFEALLGDPVDQSVGDWWHRRAALAAGESSSYLKIPADASITDQELRDLVALFDHAHVRALSVTSPLKTRALDLASPTQLPAINTLRRCATGWTATDTDEAGMRATLDAVQAAGFAPGDVAIIGRGGVSPAVVRAIEASPWRLVHHASSRHGWGADSPASVTMVVNAAGAWPSTRRSPPSCRVWVDLHYAGVDPAPEGVELHLNGDTFYDAQARAQRAFWRDSGPVKSD